MMQSASSVWWLTDSSAPTTASESTAIARAVAAIADAEAQVSGSYRSHCQPATEVASQNCHPRTEATLSSMNRNSTQASRTWAIPWARGQRTHPENAASGPDGPLTCVFLERMTRFELATLTLAKKKGEDDRPYSPSTAAQYSTVRKTVRPVRLFRRVRIPVCHHTRAMCASACLADDCVAAADHLGD